MLRQTELPPPLRAMVPPGWLATGDWPEDSETGSSAKPDGAGSDGMLWLETYCFRNSIRTAARVTSALLTGTGSTRLDAGIESSRWGTNTAGLARIQYSVSSFHVESSATGQCSVHCVSST